MTFKAFLIHSKILFLIFSFCIISFGQEDEDSLREQRERKSKSRQLLTKVIESKNKADLERAMDMLRSVVAKDKSAPKNKIDELRLQIYADTFLKLEKGYSLLTPSVRMALWEILAEGTINDSDDYVKSRCIEFIWKLMESGKTEHYSKHFVSCLEKGYEETHFYDWRYIVLALDASNSKITKDIVKKYSNKFPSNMHRIYYTREWSATLIASKHNDKKSIKYLVRLCEAANEQERFTLLFKDISCVHDKMIVAYLSQYLLSNKNLFDNSPCMPVEKVAVPAAVTLNKMIEGFPEYESYNSMEAIETCRRWMEANKDYKFK